MGTGVRPAQKPQRVVMAPVEEVKPVAEVEVKPVVEAPKAPVQPKPAAKVSDDFDLDDILAEFK